MTYWRIMIYLWKHYYLYKRFLTINGTERKTNTIICPEKANLLIKVIITVEDFNAEQPDQILTETERYRKNDESKN